jgi:hypothetical protein
MIMRIHRFFCCFCLAILCWSQALYIFLLQWYDGLTAWKDNIFSASEPCLLSPSHVRESMQRVHQVSKCTILSGIRISSIEIRTTLDSHQKRLCLSTARKATLEIGRREVGVTNFTHMHIFRSQKEGQVGATEYQRCL